MHCAVAPGTYSRFSALTAIGDADGAPNAEDMIRDLVVGNETAVRIVRGVFPIADAAPDEPTTDLLTQRMEAHEKSA